MNLDTIIVLFVLPLVAVLLSLILNVLARRGEETESNIGGYTAFEITLISSFGLPGILYFILLFSGSVSGLQSAVPIFGYLVGLITVHAIAIIKHGKWEQTGLDHSPILIRGIAKRGTLKTIWIFFLIVSLIVLASLQMDALPVLFLSPGPDYFLYLLRGTASISFNRDILVCCIAIIILVNLFRWKRIFRNLILLIPGLLLTAVSVYSLIHFIASKSGFLWLNWHLEHSSLFGFNVTHNDVFYITGGFLFGLIIFGHPYLFKTLKNARSMKDIANGGIMAVCLTAIISWSFMYLSFEMLIHFSAVNIINGSGIKDPYHLPDTLRFAVIKSALLMCLPLLVLIIDDAVDLTGHRFAQKQSDGNLMSGKRNSFFTNAIIVLFLCIAFLIAAGINLYETIVTPIFPYILLSCAVGPSILLAFFRKLSPWAVIIGMISGILICVAWHYFRIEGYRPYGIPMVHEIIPGFFIPLLLICLIDRLTPSSQKT